MASRAEQFDKVLMQLGANAGASGALTDRDLADPLYQQFVANQEFDPVMGLGQMVSRIQAAQAEQQRRNEERARAATAKETSAIDQQKGRMINQFGDQSRRQLAQDLAGARSAASSRGLLYSGLRRGAEQGLRGQAAGQMAQYRQNVNQSSADKLAGYQQQQAQRGVADYGLEAQRNLGAYQNALQDRAQKRAQGAQIGAGLGSLGGALLGSK